MNNNPDNRVYIERLIGDFNFFGIFDEAPKRPQKDNGSYEGTSKSAKKRVKKKVEK